jgi:outer membrane protein
MDLRHRFLVSVCGLMACFVVVSTARAQAKIAFFDPNEIRTKYKPFQEAEREYNQYEGELQKELKKLESALRKKQTTFERQKVMYMENRRREEEQALKRQEEDLQRFLAQITDPERGKLALKQQELLTPLLKRVNEVISQVAKEDGYDFVLNATSVVYFNDEYNLTQKVLDELNKDLEAGDKQKARTGPMRQR